MKITHTSVFEILINLKNKQRKLQQLFQNFLTEELSSIETWQKFAITFWNKNVYMQL